MTQAAQKKANSLFKRAFPYDDNGPCTFPEKFARSIIALSVSSNFRDPILSVGFRHSRSSLASMTMPEATVHEDRYTVPWKSQIRLAREGGIMKPVPKPCGVNPSSYV